MIQRHRSTGIHLHGTITGFQGRDFDNATLIRQTSRVSRSTGRLSGPINWSLTWKLSILRLKGRLKASGKNKSWIPALKSKVGVWLASSGENKRPALKWMCRALNMLLKRLSHTSRSPTVTDDTFGCPSSPIVTKMTNCRVESTVDISDSASFELNVVRSGHIQFYTSKVPRLHLRNDLGRLPAPLLAAGRRGGDRQR